jgi:hypothetical protein
MRISVGHTLTIMPELRSENPIYCVPAFETKMHNGCLEPLKNQTLKNARLPNRIINDISLMMPVDSGKLSAILSV